jgi:serine/threonine protein phosphatase PrpC
MDEILESETGKDALQAIAKEFPKQRSALEQAIIQVTSGQKEEEETEGKPLSPEQLDGKGCTAVVVVILENEIICSNAGDSRAVLAVNGVAKDLSEDHKPALEGERKRIHAAGSTITPEGRVDGNLNLSRSIGDLRYKKNKNLKPE